MKLSSTAFLLSLSCACSPLFKSRPASTAIIPNRSLVYTGYSTNSYTDAYNATYLKALSDLGANYVSILATCYTTDTTSSDVDCSSKTPTSDSVLAALKAASAAGFKTNLRVYVDLQSQDWRALWNPTDKTTAFSNLKAHLISWAKIAQSANANSFIIGAEYMSLTLPAFTENWTDIISGVRDVFSGEVSYASNWSRIWNVANMPTTPEYEYLGFWSSLDYIGIDHYVASNSVKETHPSYNKLLSMHKLARDTYEAFAQQIGKPYALTEVGINGAKGNVQDPANWQLPGPSDPLEQANWYQALLEAFSGSQLKYIYLWQWEPTSKGGHGMSDTQFGLRGRPAWDVIRAWF